MGKNKGTKVKKIKNRYIIQKNGITYIVSKKNDAKSIINQKEKHFNDQPIIFSEGSMKTPSSQAQDGEFAEQKTGAAQRVKKSLFCRRNIIIFCSCVAILLLAIFLPVGLYLADMQGPSGFRLSDEAVTWNDRSDADYYIVTVNDREFKTEEASFSVSDFYPGEYKINVKAVFSDDKKSFSSSYKFRKEKMLLTIKVLEGEKIVKEYDGSDVYSGKINIEKSYSFNNELKYGEQVDISVSGLKFNSKNVDEASELIVTYSADLLGSDSEYYRIEEGAFSLPAKILPKKIQINPSSFVKQFADEDDLAEEIIDKELGESVWVNYTRKTGEAIGFYDIMSAHSQNANYVVSVNGNGAGKFQIIPRIISVTGSEGVAIRKIYDGTKEVDLSDVHSGLYTINNSVSGYNVDIRLTSAYFNDSHVATAKCVTVEYSSTLCDDNGVYKVLASSFDLTGEILQKDVEIIPKQFIKEFGNADDIRQEYCDLEIHESVELIFQRESGENIGCYDILSVSSNASDYRFYLAEDSGRKKFEIKKRLVEVLPLDRIIEKEFDNTVVFADLIEKNINYMLDGELNGYEVDIKIISSYFDHATVQDATRLTIEADGQLATGNEFYELKNNLFICPARIKPKQISLEPRTVIKQYGDGDALEDLYVDGELKQDIVIDYIREIGEEVGLYDVVKIESKNQNYAFTIQNGENKFEIIKRKIWLENADHTPDKFFDNTDSCDFDLTVGEHYRIANTVNGETPDLSFSTRFDKADVTASDLLLENVVLTSFLDRYELSGRSFNISARILPKKVEVEPEYYIIQFGDADYFRQTYVDETLGITFGMTFVKEDGDEVGIYDVVAAVPDNRNYEIVIINGNGKYQVSPRILGVEVIGDHTFSKVYDGITACNIPIVQGLHYNLTNLNGGNSVSLNIISREFNSKNVSEATKLIVRYSAILNGPDSSQFVTVGGTMEFDAVITPLRLTVTPNLFHKDYLSDFVLSQKVTDKVSGDVIPVTFFTSAGEDHKTSECGVYDITKVHWEDTNHTFEIAEGMGKDKFVIDRIRLPIDVSNRYTVFNDQGQGIHAPQSVPDRELEVTYKLSTASDDSFTSALPVTAGTYTARVYYGGDKNYLPTQKDANLYIERAATVITNTTPDDYIYDGTVKPLTATINHDEAEVTFSRNDYINVGTYHYILISVPQTQNYKAASLVVSLTIARRIMKNEDIVFPTAGDITYGQYLFSSMLINGSDLGAFSWKTPDVKPVVADSEFTVLFSPYDSKNYDWSGVETERSVSINVNKFIVTDLKFPTASGINHKESLAFAALNGESIYGSFSWQNEEYVPLSSGEHNVVFTPYDEENYDYSKVDLIKPVYVTVSYRVQFQTNGGSNIGSMIVQEVKEPPFTYREGYIFEGWYSDELLMHKVQFPLTVTEETILYAGWYSEGLIFIKHNNSYSVKLDPATVETDVFIPSQYKGLPVTAIETEGFRGCTAIEVVVIPASIKKIGHCAFADCINLAFIQCIGAIEEIDFGIDWSATGFKYGTDVFFNAKPCTECGGTEDFHQEDCLYYNNQPLTFDHNAIKLNHKTKWIEV